MSEVAVVLHHDRTDIKWISDVFRRRQQTFTLIRPYRDGAFPQIDRLSGVISLGGPQHVHDPSRPAHLDSEVSFLKDSIACDIPVLGICLGSQLLAEALGGQATVGQHGPEVGPIWVEIAPGSDEPVLQLRSGAYFSFHEDSFELPPTAELLAWSSDYPQAFRVGVATGLQFHPEVSPMGVGRHVAKAADLFAVAGVDPAATMMWAQEHEEKMRRRAHAMFTNWLDVYVDAPGTRSLCAAQCE